MDNMYLGNEYDIGIVNYWICYNIRTLNIINIELYIHLFIFVLLAFLHFLPLL